MAIGFEDILLRIGVDTTGVSEGLGDAERKAKRMVESVKATVNSGITTLRRNYESLNQPFEEWRTKMRDIGPLARYGQGLSLIKRELQSIDISSSVRSHEELTSSLLTLRSAFLGLLRIQEKFYATAPELAEKYGELDIPAKNLVFLLELTKRSASAMSKEILKDTNMFNLYKQTVRELTDEVSSLSDLVPDTTEKCVTFVDRLRKGTHGMRGFRMELLSIMFFGMALQRIFTGLLSPAFAAVGLFELWGAVLTVLFLPIALVLLEFLMPIIEWLLNLDDTTKLVIGSFVLFGAIIASLLFAIGMFGLGIGGILMGFSTLKGVLIAVISAIGLFAAGLTGGAGALTGLTAASTTATTAVGATATATTVAASSVISALSAVAPVVLAIIAIVVLLYVAWQTNFAGIRETTAELVKAIESFISGIMTFIGGFIDFLTSIVMLDVDRFFASIEKMTSGLFEALIFGIGRFGYNILKFIATAIMQIIGWLIRLPGFIFEIMKRIFGIIWDTIKNILSEVFGIPKEIFDVFDKVPEYFFNLGSRILEAFSSALTALPKVIISAIRQIPVIGNTVADAMEAVGGFIKGAVDTVSGFGRTVADAVTYPIRATEKMFSSYDEAKRKQREAEELAKRKTEETMRATEFNYMKMGTSFDKFGDKSSEMALDYSNALSNMNLTTNSALLNMGTDWNSYLNTVNVVKSGTINSTSSMAEEVTNIIKSRKETMANSVYETFGQPYIKSSETMLLATSKGYENLFNIIDSNKTPLEKALQSGFVTPFSNAANSIISMLRAVADAYAATMGMIGVAVKKPAMPSIVTPGKTTEKVTEKTALPKVTSPATLFGGTESLLAKLAYAGTPAPRTVSLPYIAPQETKNYFVNMDVRANVSKDYDVQRLADRLEKELSLRLYGR